MLNVIEKNYVDNFMSKHDSTINKMGTVTYEGANSAIPAFKSAVKSALNDAYNCFMSKNETNSGLDTYLFGALKLTNLKLLNENKNKKTTLICPGCKEKNNIQILFFTSEGLCCPNCHQEQQNSNVEKDHKLHSTFAIHSSMGYRCPDCSKFIPHNSNSDMINCPYDSCNFTGLQSTLNKMAHPAVKISRTGVNVNVNDFSHSDYKPHKDTPSLLDQEQVDEIYKTINTCIDSQIKSLPFRGFPATQMIKKCMYESFKTLLDKYPEELMPYLSNVNRYKSSSKIQSKIFQEFLVHLEKSIPFSYTQKGVKHRIESISDERLKIFNGESIFEAVINERFEIPNLTREIYVGGRSGYYCQPYYLGKVIEIYDSENNRNIIDFMLEHDCLKIYMNPSKVTAGTKVIVKHLRIYPHYAMGVFSHLNRLKKSLAEKIQIKIRSN